VGVEARGEEEDVAVLGIFVSGGGLGVLKGGGVGEVVFARVLETVRGRG